MSPLTAPPPDPTIDGMGRLRQLLMLVALALPLIPARAAADYEIGPGDVLRISVLGQNDMSGDFTVDADADTQKAIDLARLVLGKLP